MQEILKLKNTRINIGVSIRVKKQCSFENKLTLFFYHQNITNLCKKEVIPKQKYSYV